MTEHYCQKCGIGISDEDVLFSTDNRPLCFDCYTREMYMGEHDKDIKLRKPKTRKVVNKYPDANDVAFSLIFMYVFGPLIAVIICILFGFISLLR